MTPESFLNNRVTLWPGDCLTALTLMDEGSVDSVVTDPPYHLTNRTPDVKWCADCHRVLGGNDGKPIVCPKCGGALEYQRSQGQRGFMGKKWDGGDIAFRVELWAAVFRVLKPGGHLVAFSGTRTYHRMVCAIEDAGFEVRDQIGFAYGSGFPKSHNISRTIGICSCEAVSEHDLRRMRTSDVSEAGSRGEASREVLFKGVSEQGPQASMLCQDSEKGKFWREEPGLEGWGDLPEAARELREREVSPLPSGLPEHGKNGRLCNGASPSHGEMAWPPADAEGMRPPSGPQAAEQCADELGTVALQPEPQARGAWEDCGRCGKPLVPGGLGSALKPAWEPIVLARRPLSEPTIAANVLRHGTGALNIDGCRIAADETLGRLNHTTSKFIDSANGSREAHARTVFVNNSDGKGRWPANIVTDGSEEVVAAFPDVHGAGSARAGKFGGEYDATSYDMSGPREMGRFGDAGSAARFFYSAKADSDDRLGSKHPTVKPLDLMQYLCRLVTPPGGTVLDLFAGTGTTGEAAWREGMNAVLIEREEEYQADIRRRMKLALGGPEERKRESIKASGKSPGHDDLPLFAEPPYNGDDDFAKSIDLAYSTIRERKANGGPGWTPGGGK